MVLVLINNVKISVFSRVVKLKILNVNMWNFSIGFLSFICFVMNRSNVMIFISNEIKMVELV